MSDKYFSNNKDDEYWDDIYYEEHKDEYRPSRGNAENVGSKIVWIFLIVLGVSVLTKNFAGLLLLFLITLAIFL